jgi:GNAT superfamily N-acetyltransferase
MRAPFAIRRAEPRDREPVLSLWLALVEHHRRLDRDYPELPGLQSSLDAEVDRAFFGSATRIYLAEQDGAPIGFASAEIADRRGAEGALGTIHELYVVPERRGNGVGRALVAAAEAWFGARAVGTRRVRVEISNPEALRFWHAVGYVDGPPSAETAAEPRARILLRV